MTPFFKKMKNKPVVKYIFMKRNSSYDSDFVSQREGVTIRTQTNISFLLALRGDHGVYRANFGVIKSLESLFNLTL